MLKKIIQLIINRGTIITFSVVILVVIIGAVDFYSERELGLSPFYLIPIYLVSWFVGQNPGILVAVASAAIWNVMPLVAKRPVFDSFLSYWNTGIRMALFIATVIAISKLKEKLLVEQKHARIDFMTGTANAKSFYELASLELERSRRYHHSFSTAYIDCDNFKKINDSFGHKKGNDLLKLIARTAQREVRVNDIFARVGGDEFVALFVETSYDSSRTIIERLRNRLLDEVKKNDYDVTFSFGVTTFIRLPDTVDDLLQKSDKLMYEAKKQGKDVIVHEVIE